MTIEFRCSQCEKVLTAEEDAVGRPIMCSDCGKVTHVPDPTLSPDAISPDGTSPHHQETASQDADPPISLTQIELQTALATFVAFCCMPLAFVGMTFGLMAKSEFKKSNYNLAKRYCRRAHLWTILSLVLWAVVLLTAIFIILKNMP